MFERFTERARKVVVRAQDEARFLKQNYIGTEHLLLGLIDEKEGIAAKVLVALNIPLDDVRAAVRDSITKGSSESYEHIPFTPRAKKVLEISLREALQMGHNYIGTEHILLGLLREGEGVAAQLREALGGDAHTPADESEQDVLRADVVVPELECLAQRELEDLLGTRGERDVHGGR